MTFTTDKLALNSEIRMTTNRDSSHLRSTINTTSILKNSLSKKKKNPKGVENSFHKEGVIRSNAPNPKKVVFSPKKKVL